MKVDFAELPSLGTIIMLDAQRYELVKTEPYIRKDGASSYLLTWVSMCPDCGGEFASLTGLRTNDLPRRCLEHRKPFVRVGKGRGGKGNGVKVLVIEPGSDS